MPPDILMDLPSGTTSRFVAFLRAINVGGHNVKMERLRRLFESLGLSNVETFIASGNVIFDAPRRNPRTLEVEIEAWLKESLGYEVSTFVRSTSELANIASLEPFPASELDADGTSLYVAFLKVEPGDEPRRGLLGLRNEIDDFRIHEREVYWLRRKKVGESKFSGALLEKTIGMPATVRNANTVKRLAAKYPVSG